MELTPIVVALIGVLAGAIAGATNQGLAWIFERKTTRSERAHQARLRQEQAHDRARDSLGELAADLGDWIDYRLSQTSGPEVEYFKHQSAKPSFDSDYDASKAAWTVARPPDLPPVSGPGSL